MSIWVPVIAALGASLLTSLSAALLDALRRRAEARGSALLARRAAYLALIESANGILMLGQTLRAVLSVQSGIGASLAEALRIRRPVDVYELAWRMAEHVKPILDAQAGVLACGSPKAVEASKEVTDAAVGYLQAATAMTPTQGRWRGILPWRPSREQTAELEELLGRTSKAVEALVTAMRKELGEQALPVHDHSESEVSVERTQSA